VAIVALADIQANEKRATEIQAIENEAAAER
jgi:hypothetical protein